MFIATSTAQMPLRSFSIIGLTKNLSNNISLAAITFANNPMAVSTNVNLLRYAESFNRCEVIQQMRSHSTNAKSFNRSNIFPKPTWPTLTATCPLTIHQASALTFTKIHSTTRLSPELRKTVFVEPIMRLKYCVAAATDHCSFPRYEFTTNLRRITSKQCSEIFESRRYRN